MDLYHRLIIMKISIPTTMDSDDISDVMKNIISVAKLAYSCQVFYPSAWWACKTQYIHDWLSDKSKTISDDLFMKKLEVMLLQDEERRKKI